MSPFAKQPFTIWSKFPNDIGCVYRPKFDFYFVGNVTLSTVSVRRRAYALSQGNALSLAYNVRQCEGSEEGQSSTDEIRVLILKRK
ncbi:MAG: hypothetical protein CMA63_07540 [Euryarchaeota archaeon]|nr:hypothetical protein [Euryarchaeota archaeon]